jgi:hypothetical protein
MGPPKITLIVSVVSLLSAVALVWADDMTDAQNDPNATGQSRSQIYVAAPDISASRGRTVCVRSCDGYYFPISASSSRGRWKTDAEACQSMYGAAGQAELYTYDTDGDVADAKSLTGERYGDQPFAFSYRVTYNQPCASQLQEGIASLRTRYFAALSRPLAPSKTKQRQVASLVPRPGARPANSENPETVANREGVFVPSEASAEPLRSVRQVGPGYYYSSAPTLTLAKSVSPSHSLWSGEANAAEAR